MDEYEKRIREKIFNSGILTNGEWVYLVGLFQMAQEHAEKEPTPEITYLRAIPPTPNSSLPEP